jgi:hypothetical protein
LGLLISNQYLMALGVSDFASLKPKYIITGLWTILLIVLAALPILMPSAVIKSFPKRNKIVVGAIGFAVAAGLLVIVELAVFLLLGCDIRTPLLNGSSSLKDRTQMKLFFEGCSWLIVWVWAGIALTIVMLKVKKMMKPAKYAVIGLVGCVILVSATHTIANYIYSHIPAASGGGKPLIGRLVLNKDGEAFWTDTRMLGPTKVQSCSSQPKMPLSLRAAGLPNSIMRMSIAWLLTLMTRMAEKVK